MSAPRSAPCVAGIASFLLLLAACGRSAPRYADLDHARWPHDVQLSAVDLARLPGGLGAPVDYCGTSAGPTECRSLESPRAAFPSATGTLVFDRHAGLVAVDAAAGTATTVGSLGGSAGQYQTVTDAARDSSGETVVWDETLHRAVWFNAAGGATDNAQTFPDDKSRDGRTFPGGAWELVVPPAGDRDSVVPGEYVRLRRNGLDDEPRLVMRHAPVYQSGFWLMPRIVDPTPLWDATASGGLLLVRSGDFRIEIFDSLGHPVARIRGPASGDHVTSTDLEGAVANIMRSFTGDEWRKRMHDYVIANRAPRVGSPVPELTSIQALPDGTFWVRRFPRTARDSVLWLRFTRSEAPDRHVVLGAGDRIVSGTDSSITVADSTTAGLRLRKFPLRP